MNYSFGNSLTPIKVTKKLTAKKIRDTQIIMQLNVNNTIIIILFQYR
ncbi:hypothetical protein JN11_04623 [Mucilaginibacter frigoritolerans]|uniref:Uncharacterized protein n=1 Tax=Mucilaginibacter frigoritolerans TaxID=652788 RepID=A0A562TMM6_9SPHI|nr:hypothetical protein JN11_04623 [Mucilaginibacter frigoritolerans]